MTGLAYDWAVEKLQNWAGQNVQLEPVGNQLAATFTETSSGNAQIYRTHTLPHRAEYMDFEYEVVTPGDGDELVVSYGNKVLYWWPLVTATSGFVGSGPIFIGDIAGTTDQFVWTLVTTGSPGAKVRVSNIQFYDVVGVAADFNHDGHVDQVDLQHFTACSTGPTIMQDDFSCRDADLDSDGDVDQSDFGLFQRCLSGQDNPADPACMN